MSTVLDLKKLRELTEWALKNRIAPLPVKTKAQAERMNRGERAFERWWKCRSRKRWKKGDRYYVLRVEPYNYIYIRAKGTSS